MAAVRSALGTVIAAVFIVAIGHAATGCELLVQLDRSAVEAGPDEGCPICSDAPEGDGPTDATADSGDAAPEARDSATDALPEAMGDGAADSADDGSMD